MFQVIKYLRFVAVTCFLIILLACKPSEQKKYPNIILIVVDDLGWKDTGCYGSTFYETPSIDKLASEGVRFTKAYSPHPVCGPSRASILSGKFPLRIGNTGVAGNLLASENTIAEAMKEVGYSTFFAGKWHVGMTEGRSPMEQGFDYAVGVNSQGQPGSYFYPYKDRGIDWKGTTRKIIPARDVPGLSDGKQGEYLTDRLTEETINFIENNKHKSFFAYLSHYAVHTPLEGKEEYIRYYEQENNKKGVADEAILEFIENRAYLRTNQSNPVFAAMIKSLDESVGKIMACLNDLDIANNTMVIFTSDNGGLASINREELNLPTSNKPLKYGKGWNYEGGIRVPAIIKYPDYIIHKGISDYPICLYDLYPTILDLAGIPLEEGHHVDGVSLMPVINGQQPADRKLYWYFPHKHGSGHWPSAAMLDGDFKLIWHLNENTTELYNLKEDVSESKNLATELPQKVNDMKHQLSTWIENTK